MSDKPKMPVRIPTVESYGIGAFHDQACAVCGVRHAILYMNNGVFQPCDRCRSEGWNLGKRSPWWRRMLGADLISLDRMILTRSVPDIVRVPEDSDHPSVPA